MNTIIKQIDGVRECPPEPTRLGMYRGIKARQRRSLVAECLICFIGCFIGLCVLYVVVGGLIGFACGCADSFNVLVGKFAAVGR